MLKNLFQNAWLKKVAYAVSVGMLSLATTHSVYAAPAQSPLFLTAPVTPLMMLNMSRDHQLYFKVYDDYADITDPLGGAPDGIPDITYNNNYDYYGYFDSAKCYTYNTSDKRFVPAAWRATGTRACSNQWSGNFLNWATMTRIDVIRKILYGGYRSTDSAAPTSGSGNSVTVLERAFLPNDTHSFAKFYKPGNVNELKKVVPTAVASADGITLCNTTDPANRTKPSAATSVALSQNVAEPPLIKVAKGNYSLWANNERWQCGWGSSSLEKWNVGNGNNSSSSGINAKPNNPTKETDGTGFGNYIARVQVCAPGFIANPTDDNENCRSYSTGNVKPIGLLQEFGESDSIHFGLITGSYSKNKSGGVLRKAVGSIKNEINPTTGAFQPINTTTHTNGIIDTLNRLRIFGYNYADGAYNVPGSTWSGIVEDKGWSDNCSWFGSNIYNTPYKRANFEDGWCTNWGNPQAEIYLESLRYLAGTTSATTAFNAVDSARIAGLKTATWSDPISETAAGNYCAPLNVLQFNASTISYDADQLSGATNIGIDNLTTKTNAVAAAEGILNNNYFVGAVGPDTSAAGFELCTGKNVTDLSAVRGVCPEAPRLQGSYQIAGLAYHARRVGLPAKTAYGREKVTTYGVALAPATPSVTVKVGATRSFTILPACRSSSTYSARDANALRPSNCALVDFKIVEYDATNHSGKLYVSWEDMEQGGDFDQDMWGTISYSVEGNDLTVTTDVFAESSGDKLAFGYVISGTTEDGFKAHSGVNGYTGYRCNNCQHTDAATPETYALGTSSAKVLKDPLYYAAKWGGYPESLVKEAERTGADLEDLIAARDPSNTYFFATDPRQLESSLRATFAGVAGGTGSASAVSTTSTRLTEGSLVYQALFNADDWSGELKVLTLNAEGEVVESSPKISTDNTSTFSSRNIVTYNPDSSALVGFQWGNLSTTQQAALIQDDNEAVGQKRLSWLRGDRSNESVAGGMRIREKLLGDIINSGPVYSGNKNARYLQLPGEAGTRYAAYNKDKVVYVGANDGMLHAFDAATLNEIFAYVPLGVYSKLANLTKPDYGMGSNPHQYLVDGSLTVADYYTGTAWKTVVIGTLGAGGQGVFALDVTNPSAPELLFELGAAHGIGYSLGQPIVAQMKNGSWAAVFENGYENGTSKLFVVDLNNPTSRTVIDTEDGTGLSAVALLPNALGQVEYAYAGDLAGNLWKFNLSSTSSTDWSSEKIFTAQFTSGGQTSPQPITGAPTLGRNALKNNATMIYFGTGKYFETGDNGAPALPRQSFYALADTGVTITKANLHQKTIEQASGAKKRTINGERNTDVSGGVTSAVDWATKQGWYLDFNLINGERVITKPLLAFDRLIFTTFIPSSLPCSFGGSSWLMELVAVGDRNIAHSILGDDLANTELGNAVLGELPVGVSSDKLKLIPCDITGDCDLLEGELESGSRGRMSWRQLR